MKKFLKQPLFWSTIVLGITTIAFAFTTYALAVTYNDSSSAETTTQLTTKTTSSSSPKVSTPKIGEPFTFTEKDNPLDEGLKITITEAKIDTTIQLNDEYSSEDYTGYTPVLVKAVFENTTNDVIDISSFEILDAQGDMGKWKAYLEGVSSLMPDVLTAGQKVNLTQVYAIKNPGAFDLTYGGVTWKVK